MRACMYIGQYITCMDSTVRIIANQLELVLAAELCSFIHSFIHVHSFIHSRIYKAARQEIYSEAPPAQPRRYRLVLCNLQNALSLFLGRRRISKGSPFQVVGPTMENARRCLVDQFLDRLELDLAKSLVGNQLQLPCLVLSCLVLSSTILDPRVGRFMDKSTPLSSVSRLLQ